MLGRHHGAGGVLEDHLDHVVVRDGRAAVGGADVGDQAGVLDPALLDRDVLGRLAQGGLGDAAAGTRDGVVIVVVVTAAARRTVRRAARVGAVP